MVVFEDPFFPSCDLLFFKNSQEFRLKGYVSSSSEFSFPSSSKLTLHLSPRFSSSTPCACFPDYSLDTTTSLERRLFVVSSRNWWTDRPARRTSTITPTFQLFKSQLLFLLVVFLKFPFPVITRYVSSSGYSSTSQALQSQSLTPTTLPNKFPIIAWIAIDRPPAFNDTSTHT